MTTNAEQLFNIQGFPTVGDLRRAESVDTYTPNMSKAVEEGEQTSWNITKG